MSSNFIFTFCYLDRNLAPNEKKLKYLVEIPASTKRSGLCFHIFSNNLSIMSTGLTGNKIKLFLKISSYLSLQNSEIFCCLERIWVRNIQRDSMIINLTFYSCGHAEARWVTYIWKLILQHDHPIYTNHNLALMTKLGEHAMLNARKK